MRCKACNFILSKKDLLVDDELCRHCLSTIPEDDFILANQLIDGEEELEDLEDE